MKVLPRLVAASCLAAVLLLAGCDFSATTRDTPNASRKLMPADSLMAGPRLPLPTAPDTTGYFAEHDTTGGG